MPFQFDPDEYKNKFLATVISSELRPNDNDPTREVWYAVLLRVRANPTRTAWEPIETGIACGLPGCVNIKPWHMHARWYESDRQNSAAHRFVASIKDKGKTDPMSGPAAILNKTYLWEEEIVPERRNPTTGGTWKEQRNYYIADVADFTATVPAPASVSPNGENTSELLWDAPAVTQTQVVAAPAYPAAETAANVSVAAPTTTSPLTYEEAALKIAEEVMDGKTHEEVRLAIVSNATYRAVPGLLFKFVQGTMTQELKDSNIIEYDGKPEDTFRVIR